MKALVFFLTAVCYFSSKTLTGLFLSSAGSDAEFIYKITQHNN